ncbi:MAG TPA: cation:proton antiporter [Nannocystaceae bacterium]|nr:cation:proton antiporter [Nannocystaceae bacterium]
MSPLVQDLGVCFVAAAALAVLFERLRIPTIAALLAAGVLIGPIGFSLVHSQSSIETIANLGLTLLLFVIGLEVNPAGLLASGRTMVLSGVLQVPLTIGVGTLGFLLLRSTGWSLLASSYAPLYLGAACAFSSTLLVVKLLQAKRRLDSVSGRYCVGMLIFQDVWAIVFLAVQPSFDEPKVAPILLTFAGIACTVAVAYVAARWVLPLMLRVVAKMPELVVSVALGWCFGLGLFGVHIGDVALMLGIDAPISVSMEMSALIAGASLAASPYTHEVVGKVGNLRDFFITLFFVGLGMSIPVPEGTQVLAIAATLALVAIALRYLVFLPVLYSTGLDRRHSLETATKLAQISEFCLVIAYLGARFGHLEQGLVSAVIFAFVITALITPALFAVSDSLYEWVRPLLQALGFKQPGTGANADGEGSAPRIVILGFHRVAAAVLHDLGEGLEAVAVIDFNVAVHDDIRRVGAHVVYGDIANEATLRHAGVETAELVLSTVPDELLKNTTNAQLARLVRSINERAVIITHATRIADIEEQLAAGADDVIVPSVEASRSLVPSLRAVLDGEGGADRQSRASAHAELQRRNHAFD